MEFSKGPGIPSANFDEPIGNRTFQELFEIYQTDGILDKKRASKDYKSGLLNDDEYETLIKKYDIIVTENIFNESRIDPLTNIGNRDAFNRAIFALKQEFNHPREDSPNYALIAMLDLNYLKEINDFLGHNAGDITLAKVAELLRRSRREKDTVARIGGDEFAIIAASSKSEGLQTVEENIRKSVSDIKIFIPEPNWELFHEKSEKNSFPLVYQLIGKGIEITVNMGCGMSYVSRSESTENYSVEIDNALNLADKAMYLDKEAKKGKGNIR